MNPIFEDRFAVYEDDSRLFDMAREIAKKYETLKGREMTLDVRYII
jgi:hypothetical protein